MNSTITQLDAVESHLLRGFTLNVSHNRKRAQLYRAGDGQTRAVEYGLIVATLPRLRDKHGNVISETGAPDGDGDDVAVRASRGKPADGLAIGDLRSPADRPISTVPEATPTPANGQPPSDAPPSDGTPSDAKATESIVLDQAWYTARELVALTGEPPKRFSQLFRWVESRAERPNKEYRTGQALLKRLTAMGINARLADRYKGVEGKASPRPVRRKVAPKKAAPKKTTPTTPPTEPTSEGGGAHDSVSPPSTPETAPAEAVADRAVADEVHDIGGTIDGFEALNIGEEINRIEIYADLLCELLLSDDKAAMRYYYLADDIHARAKVAANILNRLRPGIRIAAGIAE